MTNSKEKLFQEFTPISTEEWMKKIISDLKGADFKKKLIWKTDEGFEVMPFYRSENITSIKAIESIPGEFPYIRGTCKSSNKWFIRQDIIVTDSFKANKKALNILNKGVTSLGFEIPSEKINVENISTLLTNILPRHIELNFNTCNMKSVELINILVKYFKKNNFDLTQIHGSINIDFIGPILTKSIIKNEWIDQMSLAINASSEMPFFRVLSVNAYLLNNAGSSITQELGYALAWGNELLSKLHEKKIDLKTISNKIKFNFGISTNFFMEIAKFRAARWLWAIITKAYKTNYQCDIGTKINIFAQTSLFNQTIYDIYTNLLRTQTEAMSASLSGVNSLLVTPFDMCSKIPDNFSERIARNQQLLLKEECHFDKVLDPSGGSYYIESLTKSIAQKSWDLFLKTEENGFYKLTKNGDIQISVNKNASKQFTDLAKCNKVLIGTNRFPNFSEKIHNKIQAANEIYDCNCSTNKHISILNMKRLANEFESLRTSTEKATKKIKVFILQTGNSSIHLIRSKFSSNFFACAGYEIINEHFVFETIEEGIATARKENANIIVLCSSDDKSSVFAMKANELISYREILVIAGAPTCIKELNRKGITNFITDKNNMLETLQRFNKLLIN
ncbi:MAG: methylmalonyl-CoA mutase family protein [Bacteroidales bacterium OttesenSCG-928-I14]|jgi:methylmalonyl-CoA mutase|nr:methylmalonyl-CoA mutase family protein [Bacteroidales bacterium OttesenSCG-928-I14]